MTSTHRNLSTSSPSACGPSATPAATRSASRCASRSSPVEIVHLLAEVGAYGRQPPRQRPGADRRDAGRARPRSCATSRRRCDDTGLVVPMATTNLFSDPVFKDGAFTANDPRVRAYALQKTMRAIDLGVELGAKIYVFWGGREGVETDAAKNPLDGAASASARRSTSCASTCATRATTCAFALEAKPNEPRGDIYLPTTGHDARLHRDARPPGDGRREPRGRARAHGRPQLPARASRRRWDAGKLFHIDLNDQKFGRYDQDFRFGVGEPQAGVLPGASCSRTWATPGRRHFDAHAYRTEDYDGRQGLRARLHAHLPDPARRRRAASNADAEIQALLRETSTPTERRRPPLGALHRRRTAQRAQGARASTATALGARGLGYERLDQLDDRAAARRALSARGC